MRHAILTALVLLPNLAFAAGGEVLTPPKPTDTTTFCEEGFVFDTRTNTCIKAEQSSQLAPSEQMEAVRELAYAGRYGDAHTILSMMDATDDLVLTYKGFVARKLGQQDTAMAYYTKAISQNPDNLLARSYMGQGFVEEGNLTLARAELSQINARGGRNSWAAFSLKSAIRSGQGYSY